jgi:hypothetical protein
MPANTSAAIMEYDLKTRVRPLRARYRLDHRERVVQR